MGKITDKLTIDLSDHYGLIDVLGQKAKAFLQGQLTCDIEKISPHKPGIGAFCSPKGRIIALCRVFQHQNAYRLQIPKSLISILIPLLEKTARFSKVRLQDVSEQFVRFGILGISAMPETPSAFVLSKNPLCAEFIGTQAEYDNLVTTQRDLNTGTLADWKAALIQAGIPEIYPDTSEHFLPHYLNLPKLDAVSFTKGCYCGQEIIARMEYRGNLKRSLYYAEISQPQSNLTPGSTVYFANKQPAGTLVELAAKSSHLLALIELKEEGTSAELFLALDQPITFQTLQQL